MPFEPFVVKPDCPDPNSDIACTAEFKEVLCPGDCKYSNQCVATSADPSFTNETCSLVEPDSLVEPECPVPSGTPCTLEEAPVICQGDCEYANQCVATSADPTFTDETCSLVEPDLVEPECPVPSGLLPALWKRPQSSVQATASMPTSASLQVPIRPLPTRLALLSNQTPRTRVSRAIRCYSLYSDEAPVICPGDCEYANQCVATSADPPLPRDLLSRRTPDCPVATGTSCTFEEAPVICPGDCEYANQCVATSADPSIY